MFSLSARTFSHEKRVEYLSLQPQNSNTWWSSRRHSRSNDGDGKMEFQGLSDSCEVVQSTEAKEEVSLAAGRGVRDTEEGEGVVSFHRLSIETLIWPGNSVIVSNANVLILWRSAEDTSELNDTEALQQRFSGGFSLRCQIRSPRASRP
ncbi:hypothetical protein AVEN_201451-1 [Araneus ventricosus]|uniref:Uncharacterized protein n=1 Tax=Araneus ventricosus TaxID=182803 RepID=A0A4Y2JZ99_ARAVE|nr:hypothetical protein AVEN_201451-1 [Araneus ventricosus]